MRNMTETGVVGLAQTRVPQPSAPSHEICPGDGLFLSVARAGVRLDPQHLAGFDGLRVIPDVHGMFDAFETAIADARRNNRFVVQLGDLIDRGPWSPFCVERMLELEAAGLGQMILGNHEIKFAQFVLYGTNRFGHRSKTLEQFEQFGGNLLERFIQRIKAGPLWLRFGEYIFVHASFDPRMLEDNSGPPDAMTRKLAVLGPGDARERRGRLLVQGWVNKIPKGMTVMVGHMITASSQVERSSGPGGTAVFTDTGCWRNTRAALPIVDIPF